MAAERATTYEQIRYEVDGRLAIVTADYRIAARDSRLIASCATNPDSVEGIMSFLERRQPAFTQTVAHDLPAFLPWQRRSTGEHDR